MASFTRFRPHQSISSSTETAPDRSLSSSRRSSSSSAWPAEFVSNNTNSSFLMKDSSF